MSGYSKHRNKIRIAPYLLNPRLYRRQLNEALQMKMHILEQANSVAEAQFVPSLSVTAQERSPWIWTPMIQLLDQLHIYELKMRS
jgi:hypothetical protein